MDEIVIVHARVTDRHPELSACDVETAWANAISVVERSGAGLADAVLVAVGSDSHGRLLEMVGAVQQDGSVCVFHAMTPPSRKTLCETGLAARRR